MSHEPLNSMPVMLFSKMFLFILASELYFHYLQVSNKVHIPKQIQIPKEMLCYSEEKILKVLNEKQK